jgi:hypothetical protein
MTREKAFETMKNISITIYCQENGKNIDARDYMKKKYGADA